MPARAAVHTLIAQDAALADLGVTKVYGPNSVDTPPEECFIVVRWGADGVQPFPGKAPNSVAIWVHDKQRDYQRINDCLARLRELLPGATHVQGADGEVMTCADWRGEGPDLVDDAFGTITRYATFDVISRRI